MTSSHIHTDTLVCVYVAVPTGDALGLEDYQHCQGYDTSSAENNQQMDRLMDWWERTEIL